MVRVLVAFLALSAVVCAQSNHPGQVAQIFAAYDHSNTPGCAIGVDIPGRDTWTAAYGMADLEHGSVNTPATVFEAGSVSKQFTAAAVLLLVERGQMALDDNIRKYFPEIPEYERPITVRHLLNHTSGLRDWGEVEDIAGWPRGTREYKHANVLEIISRQRSLNYAPGAAWSYTNSGYNLAAMLVERIIGTTLQAFSKKEFFEPLGMTSTQWRDDFRRVVPNRAIAYSERASEWRQDMPFENVYGNGGLLTTVGDLLKWNRNITAGKLHPALFELMQKASSQTDGHPIQYGFGLFLQSFQGLAEVSHSGATAGYRAWLGRIPTKGFSAAVLCNVASANAPELAYQTARLYLDLPTPPAPALPDNVRPGLYRGIRDNAIVRLERGDGSLVWNGSPVRIKLRFEANRMFAFNAVYGEEIFEHVEPWTPANLNDFAGVYSSDEAEIDLTMAVENEKLILHRRPNSSLDLKPAYTDAFESSLGTIHFVRNASGKATGLSISGPRVWDLRFTRKL